MCQERQTLTYTMISTDQKKAAMIAPYMLYYPYHTPYGVITIRTIEQGVSDIVFGEVALEGLRRPSALATQAANEVLEYFAGKRRSFDIALNPQGSAFQHLVWDALQEISYGQTTTATELALRIGKPSSFRAVGVAIKQNPLAIVVPDHRIVGKEGQVTGADKASRLRRALLEKELGQIL